MISSNDIRPGTNIVYDGDVWQVIEFQHVKPGKGAAFVRTKLKNLRTGSNRENTFRAGEKLEKASIEKRTMQFLYQDGEQYEFMDTSNFEQMSIHRDVLGKRVLNYTKEGNDVEILFHGTDIIGVEPPNFVELEVTETDPGVRGDTAQGGTKPATLETGATVQVPLFINIGDKLRIDTRTDSYLERV